MNLNFEMSAEHSQARQFEVVVWCPRQESNLRTRLRRAVLYPLSYEGWATLGITLQQALQGYQ